MYFVPATTMGNIESADGTKPTNCKVFPMSTWYTNKTNVNRFYLQACGNLYSAP